MPAYRLCDEHGNQIGAMILNKGMIEQEILMGHPELKISYSATQTNIAYFTLELIPPEENP